VQQRKLGKDLVEAHRLGRAVLCVLGMHHGRIIHVRSCSLMALAERCASVDAANER
jgi:hypothetical protein